MKTISLQIVLRINAATSGATGLLLAIFPKVFMDIFGASVPWPFFEVGIFLIGFAALVFFVSRTRPINPAGIKTVIAIDSLWVAGSICLLLVNPFEITLIGNILVGGVALWILGMVYFQITGWKHYSVSHQ